MFTPAGRKLSEPPCSSMLAICEKVNFALGRSLYGSGRYDIREDKKRRKFKDKTAKLRVLEIDELKGKCFITFRHNPKISRSNF